MKSMLAASTSTITNTKTAAPVSRPGSVDGLTPGSVDGLARPRSVVGLAPGPRDGPTPGSGDGVAPGSANGQAPGSVDVVAPGSVSEPSSYLQIYNYFLSIVFSCMSCTDYL